MKLINRPNILTCLTLLFIGLLFISPLFPQPGYKFERLSFEKGIAHNLTFFMLKDSKGFIWFGTMHGLVKYDGKDYTLYRNDPSDPSSISFDDILSLFEDSDNNIWIGTWGGGLNKLDPVSEKFVRFVNEPKDSTTIPDNIIWAIAEDGNKNIWLGSGSKGLLKYDTRNKKFLTVLPPRILQTIIVRAIHFDGKDNLWIGTNRGIGKYSLKNESYNRIPIEISAPSVNINRFFKTKSGNLYAGSGAGLLKLDREKNAFSLVRPKNSEVNIRGAQSIAEDEEGNLWLATITGLIKLDTNLTASVYRHDPLNENSISGNSVMSVVYHESGVLWATVYERAVNKIIFKKDYFEKYTYTPGSENNLSINYVTSFAEDKKRNIWIGTFMGGINKFDPVTKSLTPYTPPGVNPFFINAI